MSIERTLMSWVRTATALIGFGFTIVQFFERLHDMEGVKAAMRPQAPRYLGLGLIASGVLALAISVWQYRRATSYMWSKPFEQIAGFHENASVRTPLLAVSIVLMFIGLFAFVSVLMRLV